jgi:ureidoacrylate peracid hydrolase
MPTDVFSEKRIQEDPKLEFDPKRTAVLVIDMVNEFLEPGGKMVLPGGDVLYPPLNQLLDAAHHAGVQVFWLNQTLRPDDALFKKRIPHCIAGSWGAQIVDALHQSPHDILVPKRRYSAFFQTDLDLYLRERKIDTLVVTGVVTNICVRSTIHDAFFMGYEVVVPVECVAATNPMAQESSLYDIETHFGMVAHVSQVVKQLKSAL